MHTTRPVRRSLLVLAIPAIASLASLALISSCSDTSSPERITVNSARASAALVGQGSGLVAAYGFDEASGTSASDASGNNNTGTFSTGVTRTTAGKFGGALSFAGNYVTVPPAASLNLASAMTLEAWIFPTSAGSSYATAIMKEQSGEYAYVLYKSAPGNPSIEFNVNTTQSGERITPAASALPVNTWSHLASTFDGSTVRLYVNGAQVASKAFAGPIVTSTGALRIGGNAVWGEFFTGRIDEVRIYNRALSAGEIQTDMTTAVSGATAPPPGDATSPTVNISSPSTTGKYTTSATSVTLSGAASDNVGVTQVTWTNNRGGSGTATGTTSWSATGVALQSGSNVVTVTARDAANNVATATLTITATTSAPPSSGGLVAAYGFNEASGTTTADVSGNNNTGTLGAGVTRTASGKFGGALSFSGSYVTVPNAASLNLTTAMTIEAWVFPTTASGSYTTAVMKEQAGQYVYALYNSAPNAPSGEFNVNTTQSGERITTGSSGLPANTWSHVASTFDGSTMRVYVNGAQVASKAFTGPIATSTGALRIGGNAVWGEFFTGRMDEVRIYSRALSAGEVQTDMNTAVGGAAGAPPAPDTQAPAVNIASPTTGATYATNASTVTLSGTASDNVGVTQVTWSNNRGGSGTAAGTTNWAASNIALQSGSNVVTVTARDAANNAKTVTLTVTYTASTVTATQLGISTQPSSAATSGAAFAQQPVVQLRDASKNAVSQSGVVVTAALASGTATLGGTLTATTNASGAASFSNLMLTGSGAQTIRFSATGLTAATSASITVSAAAPPGNYATPNLLNNASFESGWDGFTDWSNKTPSGVSIDHTRGYNGTSSILRTWTPNPSGDGGSQLLYNIASAGVDRVWMRIYVRVTAPIASPSVMKFARFYDTGFNTNLGGFGMADGDEILTWGTGFENGSIATQIGLKQSQLIDGNWHSIEVDYWRNGDPSGFPSAAFYFDNVQIGYPDGTPVKYAGAGNKSYWKAGRLNAGERQNSLKLGVIEMLATLNAGNTTTGQINMDRVAFSSAGRIGP